MDRVPLLRRMHRMPLLRRMHGVPLLRRAWFVLALVAALLAARAGSPAADRACADATAEQVVFRTRALGGEPLWVHAPVDGYWSRWDAHAERDREVFESSADASGEAARVPPDASRDELGGRDGARVSEARYVDLGRAERR